MEQINNKNILALRSPQSRVENENWPTNSSLNLTQPSRVEEGYINWSPNLFLNSTPPPINENEDENINWSTNSLLNLTPPPLDDDEDENINWFTNSLLNLTPSPINEDENENMDWSTNSLLNLTPSPINEDDDEDESDEIPIKILNKAQKRFESLLFTTDYGYYFDKLVETPQYILKIKLYKNTINFNIKDIIQDQYLPIDYNRPLFQLKFSQNKKFMYLINNHFNNYYNLNDLDDVQYKEVFYKIKFSNYVFKKYDLYNNIILDDVMIVDLAELIINLNISFIN